ncbi:MAG: alpha/beta hydrolase [Actinomycetota bacterium]
MTEPVTRVVAVHGNGGGSTRFDSMMPHVPDGVSVEAIDLPGFNGVPLDPALDSVAAYADRLGDMLTDRPVVLGHGIGGSIALDLASRRADTLSGLILHAPVGADLDTRLFPKLMSPTPVRSLIKRAIAARPLRPLWKRAFFPNGAPDPVLDTFFEGYRTCDAFSLMFDIIDVDWFTALPPVTEVPTVLLWGEHDRVLKQGQSDAIRAKAPDAEIVIQPGWDHFPMIEQPEEYAGVVADLARSLASDR